jgi:hypothetical protein
VLLEVVSGLPEVVGDPECRSHPRDPGRDHVTTGDHCIRRERAVLYVRARITRERGGHVVTDPSS